MAKKPEKRESSPNPSGPIGRGERFGREERSVDRVSEGAALPSENLAAARVREAWAAAANLVEAEVAPLRASGAESFATAAIEKMLRLLAGRIRARSVP